MRTDKKLFRVFICQDHTLKTVLDNIESQLSSSGVEVVRGPISVPGKVLDIDEAFAQKYLSGVDVAMFSSRWRCSKNALLALPSLRAIVNPTIGLETIDVSAASELGIVVGHGATPENYISMAESAVMLMLNLMYGLSTSQAVLTGMAPKPALNKMHARMVHGSTVGIVGLGKIGTAVANLMLAFGANVVAYSPNADRARVPAKVQMVDFDTLMESSDVIGLFIAVRADNRKLVNARSLKLVKPTAYLVNVSRGDAIDEQALIDALLQNRLAGAALDTFAVEPLPLDSPLRTMNNVILTPHIVGHTQESVDSIGRAALDNIRQVLNGELPIHCKNPEIEARWRAKWELEI